MFPNISVTFLNLNWNLPASSYFAKFVTRAEGVRVELSALCRFFVFCFCRCRSWSAHTLLCMRDQFAPRARNQMPDKISISSRL